MELTEERNEEFSSTTIVMEEWNGSSPNKLSRTAVLTATPSSLSLQRSLILSSFNGFVFSSSFVLGRFQIR